MEPAPGGGVESSSEGDEGENQADKAEVMLVGKAGGVEGVYYSFLMGQICLSWDK